MIDHYDGRVLYGHVIRRKENTSLVFPAPGVHVLQTFVTIPICLLLEFCHYCCQFSFHYGIYSSTVMYVTLVFLYETYLFLVSATQSSFLLGCILCFFLIHIHSMLLSGYLIFMMVSSHWLNKNNCLVYVSSLETSSLFFKLYSHAWKTCTV